MKPRSHPFIRTALFAAAAAAVSFTYVHAADITWQAPQPVSSALDVNTQGTLVFGKDQGLSDTTVNGVLFQSGGVSSYSANFAAGALGFANGQTFIGANDTEGQNYAKLLNSGHYSGATTVTITLSNLIIGQQYLVQYFVADYRGFPNDRTLTLTGGANTSDPLKFLDSDDSNGGIHASHVIGTFTADATTQTIAVSPNESAQMNGFQLRAITGSFTAANGVWTGGDGNWSTASNWLSNTIAQGTDKSATFDGLTPVTATVDVIRPIGSLNFSGANHTLAAGTGVLTLDVDTLSSPTITVEDGRTATIATKLDGNDGMTKSGLGTLVLSGVNTYSGTTTVSSGTLIAELSTTKNGLGSGAVNLGSGTTLQINNLNTTGTGVIVSNAFSGSGSLNLNFSAGTPASGTTFSSSALTNFSGAIQLTNSGATGDKLVLSNTGTTSASLLVNSGNTVYVAPGTSTFSGGTTISGSGNNENLGALRLEFNSSFGGPVTLAADARIFGGNPTTSVLTSTVQSGAAGTQILNVDGNFTASGVIGGGTGDLAVLKTGTGNVILSGPNSYTGGTTVNAGTLSLGASNVLADTGAVNVNGGALAIGGNSDTVGTVTLTGGSITGSGGILTGSSYDLRSGTASAILGGSGAVTKSTTGQLTLSGANTFTGGINVNEGVLFINGDGALGDASGAVNMNGGTIKGGAITLGGARAITLGASGGYFSNSDFLSWTINSQLTGAGFIGFNYDSSAGQSMTLASTTNDYSGETRIGTTAAGFWNGGAAILKLGAANALPYGTGKGNVIVGYDVSGSAARLDLNGFSANINGLSTNNAAISTVDNSSASAATLTLGNGDATATFGGVIRNTGAALSLVKTGSGTQTLAGVNTYTGDTTINGGTLELADDAQLRFVVTDTPAANMVTGSGTATFHGDFNIDTTGVAGTAGGIWLLVDLTSLTGESFSSTFSVVGFSDPENDGIWTMTDAKGDWSFSEATGELTLDVGTDYDEWGTPYGLTAGSEGGDLDADGLSNFEEYAFGLIPNSGSSVNPIVAQLNKATGQFSYTRRLQSKTDLIYTVRSSTTLDTNAWTNLVKDTDYTESVSAAGDIETVTITLTPAPTAAKLFLQVTAETP